MIRISWATLPFFFFCAIAGASDLSTLKSRLYDTRAATMAELEALDWGQTPVNVRRLEDSEAQAFFHPELASKVGLRPEQLNYFGVLVNRPNGGSLPEVRFYVAAYVSDPALFSQIPEMNVGQELVISEGIKFPRLSSSAFSIVGKPVLIQRIHGLPPPAGSSVPLVYERERFADLVAFRKRGIAAQSLLHLQSVLAELGATYFYVDHAWREYSRQTPLIPIRGISRNLRRQITQSIGPGWFDISTPANFDAELGEDDGFFMLTDPKRNRLEHCRSMATQAGLYTGS